MKISADKMTSCEYFPDGSMRNCIMREDIKLYTSCGKLTPKYIGETHGQCSTPSMTFYRGGKIRTVLLDKTTDITTPVGIYPAQLVIFHENGVLKRFFPHGELLSNKVVAENRLYFSLSCGSFTTEIINMSFYDSGEVRAMTLASGEEIELSTNVGVLPVRNTFSLYENGNIRSVEPSREMSIHTPVGWMELYDSTAEGGSDDIGSLQFDREGEMTSFRLSDTVLVIKTPGGSSITVEPILAHCKSDGKVIARRPLTVRLEDGNVVITGGRETITVPIIGTSFIPVK